MSPKEYSGGKIIAWWANWILHAFVYMSQTTSKFILFHGTSTIFKVRRWSFRARGWESGLRLGPLGLELRARNVQRLVRGVIVIIRSST